jgi:CBS domain-containing protein
LADQNGSYIEAYEELKSHINQLAGMPNSMHLEINEAGKRSNFAQKIRHKVKFLVDIRHLMQHHQTPSDPFLVSESLLNMIKELNENLSRSPSAAKICIPKKNIHWASKSSTIGSLTAVMVEKNYSHVPILSEEGILIGVFNETAIFSYFLSDDIIDARNTITVEDIFEYCQLNANRTELFEFVRPNTSQEKLILKFTQFRSGTSRLGAAFVTPSGSENEPITGMLTAWDVLSSMDS